MGSEAGDWSSEAEDAWAYVCGAKSELWKLIWGWPDRLGVCVQCYVFAEVYFVLILRLWIG